MIYSGAILIDNIYFIKKLTYHHNIIKITWSKDHTLDHTARGEVSILTILTLIAILVLQEIYGE